MYDSISDICKSEIERLSLYGKVVLRHKGDIISKVCPPLDHDYFCFEYQLKESIEESLCSFQKIINETELYSRYKNKLKLRIYIQSLEAQMYLFLSRNAVRILNDLNLDIEISILSWGEVKD
jgi:hypothetical protein